MEGVGEVVLQTDGSGLEEPDFRGGPDWRGWRGENEEPISKKRGAWTQSCNHAEESELTGVEECSSGEGARKEVDERSRRLGIQAEETLEGDLVVMVENIELLIGENKGRQPTEKNGDGIQQVNTEAGSRIASVVSGKPSGEDCMKGAGVGGDACEDGRHGGGCGGA